MTGNVLLLLSYMNDSFNECRILGSKFLCAEDCGGDSYYLMALFVTEISGANPTFSSFCSANYFSLLDAHRIFTLPESKTFYPDTFTSNSLHWFLFFFWCILKSNFNLGSFKQWFNNFCSFFMCLVNKTTFYYKGSYFLGILSLSLIFSPSKLSHTFLLSYRKFWEVDFCLTNLFLEVQNLLFSASIEFYCFLINI